MLLPLVGTPEWNLPHWEPLWAAIQETGIPAVMHQGTGHDMIFYRGWGSATANLLATQSMAPHAAALLSCGGVLERFPDLHVVMVEVNAGWMGWTMCTLDEYYLAHRDIGWTKPILAELPSHYLRRQVHATFQDDPIALHNVPFTGSDCLLWGNDYPHPESTYPNSNKVLDDLLADVDDDVARAVVFDNARRLFGFGERARAGVVTSPLPRPDPGCTSTTTRPTIRCQPPKGSDLLPGVPFRHLLRLAAPARHRLARPHVQTSAGIRQALAVQPSPLLQSVDAVTIPVPDLDTGLAFYRDVLGHALRWRNDTVGQAGLSLADSETEIVLTTEQGYEPNWLVESVAAAAARVRAGGGSVLVEPFDIPVGKVVVVADPFQNVLVMLELSKGRYATDDHGDVTGVTPP